MVESIESQCPSNTGGDQAKDNQYKMGGKMPGVSTEDILLVNDEAVSVNKHVLAACSNFFRALFFGENAEEVPRVQIDGPDAVAQFERLVTATHDQRRVELNDECVEDILLLANRFQFDSVVSDCFEFLVHSSKKLATCKFRLADQCENIIVKKKILNAMTKHDFAWQNYFKNRAEEYKMGSGAINELKERLNELKALDEGEKNV
uniref:BTB domain-containing protein n=1 Tax=Globodera pallida TaxID=36090 RepID=A0A183BNN0_GLOPA